MDFSIVVTSIRSGTLDAFMLNLGIEPSIGLVVAVFFRFFAKANVPRAGQIDFSSMHGLQANSFHT